MHGASSEKANEEFRNRLDRIRQGREGALPPEDCAAYDPATQPRKVVERQVSPLPDWRENIRYPALIVGAFVLGLVAVVMSRWVRFHMSGRAVEDAYSDLNMMIDGGMAFAIGFVLRMLFNVEGKEFIAAKTVGIFVMVSSMHNLVHAAPGAFTSAFSPEWVDAVVTTTDPSTVIFQGMTFEFGSGADTGTRHAGMGGSGGPGRIVLNSDR
jgi:hypothetical protein